MTKLARREDLLKQTARYRTMEEASTLDFAIIESTEAEYAKTEPDRVLDMVRALKGWDQGLHVDVHEHSVQTATRAFRDGRSDEYVVCALLHDIGDTISVYNHADIAAAIVRPFVSEDLHWMVAHHAIFQLFHKKALPLAMRNTRDQFKDHPCFDLTAEFCELYDQVSFDEKYESMELEAFEPIVRTVFSNPWGRPYAFQAIDLATMDKC